MEKHSSLLLTIVIYGRKKFHEIFTWGQPMLKTRVFADHAGKACYRHSSLLLLTIVNYGRKKFMKLSPGLNIIKNCP